MNTFKSWCPVQQSHQFVHIRVIPKWKVYLDLLNSLNSGASDKELDAFSYFLVHPCTSPKMFVQNCNFCKRITFIAIFNMKASLKVHKPQ